MTKLPNKNKQKQVSKPNVDALLKKLAGVKIEKRKLKQKKKNPQNSFLVKSMNFLIRDQ